MNDYSEVPSPIRQYTALRTAHRLRHLYWKTKLGSLGKDTYIDKRVHFERFPMNISVGSKVILKEGVRLCPTQPASKISIGDWTSVGYSVHIFAASGVTIGENCLIGPFSYIVDNHHQTDKASLIREQPLRTAPIVIEEDVWLGVRCIVLAGVTIGRGSVISAGSVLFQDIPPYSIVAGSPARVIGQR